MYFLSCEEIKTTTTTASTLTLLAHSQGAMFLIVVDAHSKWPEVMTTTTASKTIEELRKLFATHGLPEQHVS